MGGLAQMTNPNWPQWVSTLTPPKGNELANGTYRPIARTGELFGFEEGYEVGHRVVRGAALD